MGKRKFLGFLVFGYIFFKVEIFAFFCDLKKSYLHQISLSSTSRLNVKTRLLLRSEGSRRFFRSIVVDLIDRLHETKNSASILTLKTGGPF